MLVGVAVFETKTYWEAFRGEGEARGKGAAAKPNFLL